MNEESKSANAALELANTRLRRKVEALEKSHDDVQNLLASSDIATLFLDLDMRIRLFSPSTAKLLGLHPGDIGRPITDFVANVANDDLLTDAKQVIETLMPVETDVWSRDEARQKRCYLRRIVPYRSADARIGGVVITFVDITDRRRLEEQLEALVSERTRTLHDRERRLRTIVNSVGDAILIVGRDGLIQSINKAGADMFGYADDQLVGANVSLLMPSPYREEHNGYIARYLKTGEPRIMGKHREFSGCRKDGSSFPLELTVTEVEHLGLFAGIIRDLTTKRALEREVANASALEQERIGREIHDGIGQQLTGLNMLAVSLKNELDAAGFRDNKKLDDMIGLLTALIGEARTLSRGLAPVAAGPRALVDALNRLAAQVRDAGIACEFIDSHTDSDLREGADAAQIYRIAQEAINNALKHANATRIVIELDDRDAFTELTVRDDGVGFDPEKLRGSGGFGMRIMRYRTGILGGHLFIDSAPGSGTQVRLQLPHQA